MLRWAGGRRNGGPAHPGKYTHRDRERDKVGTDGQRTGRAGRTGRTQTESKQNIALDSRGCHGNCLFLNLID